MLRRPLVSEAEIRDVEARGRKLPRGLLRGYRADEVDTFLSELFRALRDLFGVHEALREGVSPEGLWWRGASRVSPQDVQDRRFHGVRFGGYDMRAVDEYLDEVTDLLVSLSRENEALRSTAGTEGGGIDR